MGRDDRPRGSGRRSCERYGGRGGGGNPEIGFFHSPTRISGGNLISGLEFAEVLGDTRVDPVIFRSRQLTRRTSYSS